MKQLGFIEILLYLSQSKLLNLSVIFVSSDHIFVGPSPSLIRPSELGEEHIFQVSAEDGSVIAEPATALQLKIHEMTPLHLEIYKGMSLSYVRFRS